MQNLIDFYLLLKSPKLRPDLNKVGIPNTCGTQVCCILSESSTLELKTLLFKHQFWKGKSQAFGCEIVVTPGKPDCPA